MIRIARALPSLFLFFFTSCLVGPGFVPPQQDLPEMWINGVSAGEEKERQPISGTWWQGFNDPILSQLIEEALSSSLDLQQAVERVREARASWSAERANLFPQLGISTSYRRSNGLSSASSASGIGSSSGPRDFYQSGFDASWEIDVFGGRRRAVEAAQAEINSAEAAQQNALVSLTGDLAANYVQLRAYQEELVVAEKNLEAQVKSVELSRQRYESGFVSYLDVANAQAQVASLQAVIPQLQSSIEQTKYAISVLLGKPPSAHLVVLNEVKPVPVSSVVPSDLPSDVLRKRPDIKVAEAQFHAAIARIGVARADLFPKFSLTATAGLASSDLHNLTSSGNRLWSIVPEVSYPIFDAGQRRALEEVAQSRAAQSLIDYERIILEVLKEVESTLVAYNTELERKVHLEEAVSANRVAVNLATQLYSEGQTDFLNVLSAKRQLYVAEDALSRSKGTISLNLIALYKALGGGWDVEVPQRTSTRW